MQILLKGSSLRDRLFIFSIQDWISIRAMLYYCKRIVLELRPSIIEISQFETSML